MEAGNIGYGKFPASVLMNEAVGREGIENYLDFLRGMTLHSRWYFMFIARRKEKLRQDKWFPGVLAMAIAVIAIASIFNPISYFTNIANAIVLPVFLLTVVEVVGHIKNSALRELHLELSREKREEEWMRGYYAVAKEGKDEASQKVVMDYEELCNSGIKLADQITVVSSWFKCYAPISIIFWVLLVCAALLGNLELVIRFSSGINVTTITLFTLSIFIGEPHITDFFVRIVRRKAEARVDSSAI